MTKAEKARGGRRFGVMGFLCGAVMGASLMFSAGLYVSTNHPFYMVEVAFGGLHVDGLDDAAEARVEKATGRFVQALMLAEEYHGQRELDDATVGQMMNTALHELDPYSGFMDANSSEALTSVEGGEDRPRLGVTIMDVDGQYVIESVMPGSPAEIVGLMPGDRVVRVGDQYVGDESPRLVNEIIHDEIDAKSGGEIRLGVRRIGKLREVTIDIDPEPVRAVGAHNLGRENGVVHIYLERFYEGASEDVANILRREMRQGGLKGAILDLRNNGGGLTTEVQKLGSLFLPKGSLLYEMSGRVIGVETVRTELAPEFPDLRLSVIVNGYSASSSEIFASAIQAHKRGKIVGWTSFGKGTVQRVYPVKEGAIKITVAEYKDGGLRKINEVGVQPDIPMPGEDPKFRPSRFSKDEARERARIAAGVLPYVASQ